MNLAKLEDVARRAGVSKSTASLALRGVGRVNRATRDRVRQIATEMGYHPDPLVSQFQAAVRAGRPPKFEGVIAWINDHGNTYFKNPWRSPIWEGACERALERGFKVEMFPLGGSPEVEPVRELDALARTFRARSVAGLLLGDLRLSWALRRSWEDFPVVTLCDQEPVGPPTQRRPWHLAHPLIEPDHYVNMLKCLRHLCELGYRRPGLVTTGYFLGTAQEAAAAAYQRFVSHLPGRVPPILVMPQVQPETAPRKRLGQWLERYQPDVLVTAFYEVAGWLKELGHKVPEDLGLAHHNSVGREIQEGWSGITVEWRHIGSVAMDHLIGRVQAGETRPPSRPTRLLIEGEWHAGRTVRLRRPGQPD